MIEDDWIYDDIEIGEVENLIRENQIEVWSPDGWVGVTAFVDKGLWPEHVLTTDCDKTVRCNGEHLFKVDDDWVSTKQLIGKHFQVQTECGQTKAAVQLTDKLIPIVDIQVDHPNHRYYTEGIESHNTNVGKSALLCAWAADWLADGYDVLYISNEMSEEMVSERIDANLLDLRIEDLPKQSKDWFLSEVNKIKRSTAGRLVVHEYPTRTASVRHFRKLIKDLETKKKFKPRIIIVDYINNMLAATVRQDANSYERIKAICEELRGLACELDLPILAPTQTNRQGQNNTDVNLEEVSESHGLSQTADLIFALMRPENLRASNQILVKQLKNRLNDMGKWTKFVIGFDFYKMQMYETTDQSGAGFADEQPGFDKTSAGKLMTERGENLKW
jgi:hypothetical protein